MKIPKKESLLKNFSRPILISVISGLVLIFIQNLLKDSKEIKYKSIELNVFHNINENGTFKIVNGQTNKSFFGHKVIFENSGNLPIKDFSVEYKLSSDFQDIELTNLNHQTFPEKNFGEIKILKVKNDLIKIQYELINPNDRFEAIIFHNRKASLEVYGKGEGVSIKETKFSLPVPNYLYILMISPIIFTVIATIYLNQNQMSKEDIEELQKAWEYYSEKKQKKKIK